MIFADGVILRKSRWIPACLPIPDGGGGVPFGTREKPSERRHDLTIGAFGSVFKPWEGRAKSLAGAFPNGIRKLPGKGSCRRKARDAKPEI